MKFSTTAWTRDGKGFFYGRYPEPPAGKAIETAVRDKKIYYHVLGTNQSADRLIYERPEEPMLFIDADLDETARYLFIQTNKGTSNKNELFVKDLGDASAPKLDAPVTPLYPGHTAAYLPLGVVNGTLYLQTDREAPLKKIVAVPIERPDVGELEDDRAREQGRDRVGLAHRRADCASACSRTSRARCDSIGSMARRRRP